MGRMKEKSPNLVKTNLSLPKRFLDYFMKRAYKNPDSWTTGTKMELLAERYQHKPSYGARCCRRLASKGFLENRINKRGCVEYRYNLIEDDAQDDPYDT